MGGRNSRKRFLGGRRIRKHVQLSLLEEEPSYSGVSAPRQNGYNPHSTYNAHRDEPATFSAAVYDSKSLADAVYPVVRNNGLDVYLKYGVDGDPRNLHGQTVSVELIEVTKSRRGQRFGIGKIIENS